MTDRQFVIRTTQLKGISLFKPTKACPGIVATDFTRKDARGVFPCVIDAQTWADARTQLINYSRSLAA